VAARLRKFREATFESADGVVSLDEMFRNAFLQHSPQLTTPATPFKGGFAVFFDGASTPPVPGGEHPHPDMLSFPTL
jgi:hypothetical protein